MIEIDCPTRRYGDKTAVDRLSFEVGPCAVSDQRAMFSACGGQIAGTHATAAGATGISVDPGMSAALPHRTWRGLILTGSRDA